MRGWMKEGEKCLPARVGLRDELKAEDTLRKVSMCAHKLCNWRVRTSSARSMNTLADVFAQASPTHTYST